MSTSQLSLRAATENDLEFLFGVYVATRQEELAQVPWSAAQKEAFLRQQFHAQHAWWHEHYASSSFDLIVLDGVPAGRFYVHRGPSDIRVVDIALLPEHRGGGVGTRLLREVFAEADRDGKRVSVHVEKFNPALRLYERLGFEVAEDKGVYLLMSRAGA